MSQRREPSSPSLRRIRALSAAIALALAATVFAAVPTTPAGANDVPSWLATVNNFRQSQGLAPLQVDAQLAGLAQQQAQVMADRGDLVHTANLAAGVTANWTKLGENVGVGRNLDAIWPVFLASPPHLANLVDPAYTHIGIGIVIVGNAQWVVHRFMGVGAPAPVVVAPQPAPVYVPPVTSAPKPTAPPTTRPAPVTTTTTVTLPEPEPVPEPVVVPAASAPDRAAALLDALHRIDR